MTHDNCLEGIRCPQCGQDNRFKIFALITCVVTNNGSEPVGDHGWDDNSSTHCPECDFDGTLKQFRNRKHLPPDPENMNDNRAAWAGAALSAFMMVTGIDEEDALGDLLADLMHWADRHGYDFDAALDRGRWHYDAETGRECPT